MALPLDLVAQAVLLGVALRGRVAPVGMNIATRVAGIEHGVEVLAAACDEPLLEQLRRDAIEERLRTRCSDPVLDGPHPRAVRDIGRSLQATEALAAHAVKQRVSQRVEFLAVLFVGEQVGLDGATRFHRAQGVRGSGRRDSNRRRLGDFFEPPY